MKNCNSNRLELEMGKIPQQDARPALGVADAT
jgi:hypothetical protein